MARNNNKKQETKGIGEWNGFANIPFGREDVNAALKWGNDVDVFWLHFEEMVAADYKVTVNRDMKRHGFIVSVSCYDEDSPNYKYTMTSRAPSAAEGMVIAVYKHVVISGGVWKDTDDDLDAYG